MSHPSLYVYSSTSETDRWIAFFAAEISNYSTIYCRWYNVVDAKAIKNCALPNNRNENLIVSLFAHGLYQSQQRHRVDTKESFLQQTCRKLMIVDEFNWSYAHRHVRKRFQTHNWRSSILRSWTSQAQFVWTTINSSAWVDHHKASQSRY